MMITIYNECGGRLCSLVTCNKNKIRDFFNEYVDYIEAGDYIKIEGIKEDEEE